jgi:predicted metal-binding membrane protein
VTSAAVRPLDRRVAFLALLSGLIALAWLALWVWGRSAYGSFLSHEKAPESTPAAFLFVLGWTLMAAAMMLPTSLPLLEVFRRVVVRRPDRALLLGLVVGGYLAVWAGFGALAHMGDRVVHVIVHESGWLSANVWAISATTLLAAGVYQFTPLKKRCLRRCRSPLALVASHWHGAAPRSDAVQLGLHHAAFCLGCCWLLMLLMFAVGIGNLGWMLVLAAVVSIEKNARLGARISAPLGLGLLATGLAVLGAGA